MKSWNEFIEHNTENYLDVVTMINDYEELQSSGTLGVCMLRNVAHAWIENLGVQLSVTSTMLDIAFECYKNLAKRYIKEVQVKNYHDFRKIFEGNQ